MHRGTYIGGGGGEAYSQRFMVYYSIHAIVMPTCTHPSR